MNLFKLKSDRIKYADSSKVASDYTEKMDKEYNWMANGYDFFMTIFPLWKKWIKKIIPHIQGEKILEVSFGTGYLMTQYSSNNIEVYGIDYNQKMLEITLKKTKKKGKNVTLLKGNVEQLPFPDEKFDTVINTMAFTGYPDGDKAMSELNRVLKKDGVLLMVDFDYPRNRNIFGYLITRLISSFGDVIKDISSFLLKYKFEYRDIPVGGFGSVHLFIAKKT